MLTTRDVIDALLLGLSLATIFGMGPAFFTLVQTSINKGFKTAMMFALGVALNDIIMIMLCIMTSVKVLIEGNELFFGIAAGIILIAFGVFTFIQKPKTEPAKSICDDDKHHSFFKGLNSNLSYVMKGFALNILNPFVWIFWIGTVALMSSQIKGGKVAVGTFFAITMAVSMSFDTLKALGASALKRFFSPRRITLMNNLIGIILVIFGIFFILRSTGVINA